MSDIRSKAIAGDDVVSFLVSKLQQHLAPKSQKILALGSALGASFQFSTLKLMASKIEIGNMDGTSSAIGDLKQEDLQELTFNNYLQIIKSQKFSHQQAQAQNADEITLRFSHDRIRKLMFKLFRFAFDG